MAEFDPAVAAGGESFADWSIERSIRRSLGDDPGQRWSYHADDEWNYVVPSDGLPRPQGWKLHVSGTVLSAREILDRVLPALFSGTSAFKIARDLAFLESLSEMHASRESAGKFITIYPPDDRTCGSLAAELDARLTGLHGPAVLSDPPYRAAWSPADTAHSRPGTPFPPPGISDRRSPHPTVPWWRTGGSHGSSSRRGRRHPRRSRGAAAGESPRGTSGRVLLAERLLVAQALRLSAKGGSIWPET
jgi:hypothetical protein